MQPTRSRDQAAVAVLLTGAALLVIGCLAVWLIVPLLGAILTIGLGAALAGLGIRSLLRMPR